MALSCAEVRPRLIPSPAEWFAKLLRHRERSEAIQPVAWFAPLDVLAALAMTENPETM